MLSSVLTVHSDCVCAVPCIERSLLARSDCEFEGQRIGTISCVQNQRAKGYSPKVTGMVAYVVYCIIITYPNNSKFDLELWLLFCYH